MPIPNVYTATEDPTSQVGNNGDIYFHTGLIGLSAINVYKKVAGRWGLTGSISTASEGRAFNSTETVRIDPSGDDSTGKIGELTLPFATTQGAVDAFELLNPLPSNPIILIGGNAVAGFQTILPYLTVIGANAIETVGSQRTASAITSNITMSATDGPEGNSVVLFLINCWTNHFISFDGAAPLQELNLINSSGLVSVVFNATTSASINGTSLSGSDASFSRVGTVAYAGGGATFLSLNDVFVQATIQSADGTDVYLIRSTVTNIAASINNLFLTDSFIVGTNSAGTTNTNFGNVLFNPANWDFSSLPTSQPSQVGKAWIDTAAGLNIVKVKL